MAPVTPPRTGPGNLPLDGALARSPFSRVYARTHVRDCPHHHATGHRRIARQGENHREISRQGLQGSRQLRSRPRPAAQGWQRPPGRGLRDGLGTLSRQAEALQGNQRRGQGRRTAGPRDRPRSRGRGDFVARARTAEEAQDAARQRRPRDFQRDHQAGGDRGDEGPARARPAADRCLSRAPRARLSLWLHAFAGAVAAASRCEERGARAIGRPAADRRPRNRDRALPCR